MQFNGKQWQWLLGAEFDQRRMPVPPISTPCSARRNLVPGTSDRKRHCWSGFDVRQISDLALEGERQIQSATGINILPVVL